MYRVIIVDDEPMVCDLIKRLLLPLEDIEIAAALYDGAEAVRLLKSLKPDIIITDIRMPNMDGLNMLHQVHAIDPGVVVIILSAYGQFEYARQALCDGAFEYLLKPIDENQLHSAVRRAQRHLNSQYRKLQDLNKIKRELNKLQSEVALKHQQENIQYPETVLSQSIQAAIQYLHENFAEDITLSMVADRVFLNRTYLSELFKTETGQGFNKYLTNLRIKKAKTLLLVPSLKISEISHMVGFQDTSYFVRTFKELTGSTPQEYRMKAISQNKGETDHETEMPRMVKPGAENSIL